MPAYPRVSRRFQSGVKIGCRRISYMFQHLHRLVEDNGTLLRFEPKREGGRHWTRYLAPFFGVWHSDARSLERQGIPREFVTQSRVVIICNDWTWQTECLHYQAPLTLWSSFQRINGEGVNKGPQ